MIDAVQVTGVFAENAYFYIDEQTGSGFLIDPGAEPERLYEIIRRNGWTIEAILLTHGHFDHTGAIPFLYGQLRIPYYISPPGEEYLTDPMLNLSGNFGPGYRLEHAKFFKPGDFIALDARAGFGLHVLATPGHTPDSCTLYSPEAHAAFVGDAIFRGGPGTAQFPGGNEPELMASIRNTILRLPEDTVLYSGHTPPTSVGAERPNYF